MEAYQVIPLLTALLYTIGALCIKRATTYGVGPWRTTFFSNLVLFLLSFPLWFFGEPIASWQQLLMPVLVGGCFFLGQLFSCLAIHKGDVSVFTPLMGTKSVFVAFIVSIWLHESMSYSVWLGAVLSAIAILLMRGQTSAERSRVAVTVGLALACSLSFAAADAAMQAFGSVLGFEKLTASTFTMVMIYSFALLPRFRGPVSGISRTTWAWLIGGASVMAVQACMMAYALSVYGKATVINVIYSSRGVWGVVLVWAVGHWFSNEEKSLGSSILGRRLLGALLLILAIVAVMS